MSKKKDIVIRLHDWARIVQFERGATFSEYRTIMAIIKEGKLYIRTNTRLDAKVRRDFGMSRLDIISVDYARFDELIESLGNEIAGSDHE